MQVEKYNISKPRKYVDKHGNEKTQWNNIGTLTEFHKDDGSVSRIIEIPAIGLEANVFEQKDKEEGGSGVKPTGPGYMNRQPAVDNTHPPMEDTVEYPEEEISAEDIPF